MPDLRTLVQTIVLVMLENRSFDHMLGHLSLDALVPGVDGLTRPLASDRYANPLDGALYYPWPVVDDGTLSCDLPHEADAVTAQLAKSAVTGRYDMNGFVEAYAKADGCRVASSQAEPMAFCRADRVPVTSFVARSYCTCDRWFAPIPTSTQPNKTMALTGASPIATTGTGVIDAGPTVLDWLTAHGVRWRVYHDGFSFFTLYKGQLGHVFGPNFAPTSRLALDVLTEPDATFPQVIVVEPAYDSIERMLGRHGNDNHAPLPVGFGEAFLRRTYQAVVGNPARWATTVMVLSYDEHGGFWDHVPPLPVRQPVAAAPGGGFESTGPRVPAIVLSSLVDPGSVCHAPLDHTSVLQFLAERFGAPGTPYSDSVEARRRQGIASVSAALTRSAPRPVPPPHAPTLPLAPTAELGTPGPPADAMQQSFAAAVDQMVAERPADATAKYPDVVHWQVTTLR